MSRKCENYQSLLVAYLDGELSKKESRTISEHLRSCNVCQRELEDIRGSMDALLDFAPIEPSEGFDRIFHQKLTILKEESEEKESFWPADIIRLVLNRNYALISSAAFAILFFIVTFAVMEPQKEISSRDIRIAENFDLFFDLEVIEQSEALEHFEVINLLDILEQEING
jgi:hypothetical protein